MDRAKSDKKRNFLAPMAVVHGEDEFEAGSASRNGDAANVSLEPVGESGNFATLLEITDLIGGPEPRARRVKLLWGRGAAQN